MQWSFGLFAHPFFHGDYPDIVKTKLKQGQHAGVNDTWPLYLTDDEVKFIKGTSKLYFN